MSEIKSQNPERVPAEEYFLPRNFEIVQPIYDLAFLLKINGSQVESAIPKYRIFSLGKAAHSLDGYSAVISKWLKGQLNDNDLDYVPSARIRDLLGNIIANGTIQELQNLLSPEAEGCLRLRSLRGLGARLVSEFLKSGLNPSHELLTTGTRRCGIPQEEILAFFQGRSGSLWQAPHIIPPLMRFLNGIEEQACKKLKWHLNGITDGISPAQDPFVIYMGFKNIKAGRALLKGAAQKDPFFKVVESSEQCLIFQHQMGWRFQISPKTTLKHFRSLHEIVWELDPLACELPTSLRSDLHIHTSWSDGIATPEAMVQAAKKLGLEFIAITEHSRSSKLQRGLAPSTWLRQAMSVSSLRRDRQVLHGMEVDILRDGTLDMPEGILCGMDLVVASMHSSLTDSKTSNTSRIIKAIETGHVDVIGHPTAVLMGRPGEPSYIRSPIKVDWDTVFEYCSKWHVALEINCFPSRFDLSPQLAKKAMEEGCWISLGTDAHSCFHLEALKFGAEIAEKAGVGDKILNRLSFTEIQEWLRDARKTRSQRTRKSRDVRQANMFASCLLDSKERSAIEAFLNERSKVPKGSVVVGLDLTGGKNKKTGVALLSGMTVETTSLLTDEDMLSYIKEKRPAIVSIDSPLGLPGGGEQIDPEAGIVRIAERHLSSVGIPSYPALIDSMKGLTLRGIRLRKMIESLIDAPTVIESYPGAAQDLLCIPRKQRGLNLLREGLKALGLRGRGLSTNSHDEMDAITSAIVGRFFEVGQYEPMGIISEAQLIVPRTTVLNFSKPPIICIGGKTGSGKSVVSRYLALYYGFKWIKTCDIIYNLVKDDFENITTNRLNVRKYASVKESHLRDFGKIIMEEYNQLPLQKRLAKEVLKFNEAVVVDSVRSNDDLDASYTKDREIYVWYISCPDSIVRERWTDRRTGKGDQSIHYATIDRNADMIMRNADIILKNNGTLENLHRLIDDIFFSKIAKIAIK